jgi:hypothetical protein
MRLKEIKAGNFFNIENTPTYPKLRIEGGYIDLRDNILNKTGNCDAKEVTEMTIDEIASSLRTTVPIVNKLIDYVKHLNGIECDATMLNSKEKSCPKK